MDIDEYYAKMVGFSPNPLQTTVWDKYFHSEGHPALLVKAGTGTGKTEAILLPVLKDERRVIMVLPSKALIEDMSRRIEKIGKKLTQFDRDTLTVTVDIGGSCRRYRCQNGTLKDEIYHRHLFADDVIITTLDKFLFRLFGYGEKIKSYIFPHRIFGSALGKKPFVIFDEAHDYEGLAYSNFRKLVEALYIKGKDLCVMSATLPAEFADFLSPIDCTTAPLLEQQIAFQVEVREMHYREKRITLLPAGGPDESIVKTIANQVREKYGPERRIIARTEFVRDLIMLHHELKDLSPLIYHGRLAYQQRRSVIDQIIDHQGKNQGFLVLATSAIEAGCDLDVHLIVTELCNPDSLVQLAGRLNRRGKMKGAELIVVGDKIKPSVSFLDEENLANYLGELHAMNGYFDPDRLQRYFQPPKSDWMGEILFDMLWEYIYEGDLTNKPLWDRGILVTRSWEPSITLCTGLHPITKIPINPVQVGISRMAAQSDMQAEDLKKEKVSRFLSVEEDGTWHADIHRGFFNTDRREESRWSIYPFPKYRISAYETTLFCVIQEQFRGQYFDQVLGYVKLPKLFLKSYRKGFERTLQYKPERKKDGTFKVENNRIQGAGTLWYLER